MLNGNKEHVAFTNLLAKYNVFNVEVRLISDNYDDQYVKIRIDTQMHKMVKISKKYMVIV